MAGIPLGLALSALALYREEIGRWEPIHSLVFLGVAMVVVFLLLCLGWWYTRFTVKSTE